MDFTPVVLQVEDGQGYTKVNKGGHGSAEKKRGGIEAGFLEIAGLRQ